MTHAANRDPIGVVHFDVLTNHGGARTAMLIIYDGIRSLVTHGFVESTETRLVKCSHRLYLSRDFDLDLDLVTGPHDQTLEIKKDYSIVNVSSFNFDPNFCTFSH